MGLELYFVNEWAQKRLPKSGPERAIFIYKLIVNRRSFATRDKLSMEVLSEEVRNEEVYDAVMPVTFGIEDGILAVNNTGILFVSRSKGRNAVIKRMIYGEFSKVYLEKGTFSSDLRIVSQFSEYSLEGIPKNTAQILKDYFEERIATSEPGRQLKGTMKTGVTVSTVNRKGDSLLKAIFDPESGWFFDRKRVPVSKFLDFGGSEKYSIKIGSLVFHVALEKAVTTHFAGLKGFDTIQDIVIFHMFQDLHVDSYREFMESNLDSPQNCSFGVNSHGVLGAYTSFPVYEKMPLGMIRNQLLISLISLGDKVVKTRKSFEKTEELEVPNEQGQPQKKTSFYDILGAVSDVVSILSALSGDDDE